MPKELTERQKRVLAAIQQWIKDHGYPPTIRELGKELGIKSLRGVTTHLDAIAKKGYLTRERAARGLRLMAGAAQDAIDQVFRIPIVGRVAAGQPVLAEENIDGHLFIDALLFGKSYSENPTTRHFALKVKGASMQGAGILDGDFVIVRQQPQVENGEIVVALLGDDATVKRFYREDGQIRLQPENPTMDPIMVGGQQPVDILGKVVGVFRRLN